MALAWVACGGPPSSPREPDPIPRADGASPEEAPADAPPLPRADGPADVAAGARVFERACASCHDRERTPRTFVREIRSAKIKQSALVRKMRAGSGPPGDSPTMPAIGPDLVPDSELPVLMAYLRSIGAVAD